MSHQISEISISNFKSIKDQTFEFSSYTPLVGYNNAGKTNLLEALKWVLRKSSLPTSSFYNVGDEISVIAKISGVTTELIERLAENHQTSVRPFVSNGELFIKRTQLTPNASVGQIKLYVKNPNTTDNGSEWQLNPAGIDNAIKDLFPEPIHIGAMENSEEDVSKSKTSSTIGKLLSEIIGPIEEQYGQEVRNTLEGLKKILDADGEERAPELNQFDTEVNQKLDTFFPDVKVKIHVPTPDLKEVFSKGTIKVYENQLIDGREVSALGHGAQRSIQMTLIRHLADLRASAEANTTTTLLLIDEPELYLHPQAIEIVREALKRLSNQSYQVIFTTHSPFMITSQDVENTILIRKNTVLGTHKRNSLRTAIPQVTNDAPSQTELLFSISNSSQILFSERVILAEGKTENKLLPKLIENVTSQTIGIHKLALVPLNGSGSMKKSISVLNAMDLPCKAIVDLDYVLKNAISEGFLQANDPDILACKSKLAVIAPAHGIGLAADGWPTKINSSKTASEAFEILAVEPDIQSHLDSLKTKLNPQGIWFWKRGTIETHLGLPGKSEAIWANFSQQLDSSSLQTILPDDFLELEQCINWMLTV